MSKAVISVGEYSFSLVKGEDFAQEILIRDAETQDPVDIADYQFAADCRDNFQTGSVLFSFTFNVDANPLTGRVVMSVDKDITAALIPEAGVYDMFVTYTSSGKREPYLRGNVTFLPASTQYDDGSPGPALADSAP